MSAANQREDKTIEASTGVEPATRRRWLILALIAGLVLYPALFGTLGILGLELADFLPASPYDFAGGVLNYSNLVGLTVFAFVWWCLYRGGTSLSAIGFPTRWRWWQLLLLGAVVAYLVFLSFTVPPGSVLGGGGGSETTSERISGIFVNSVRAGVVEETIFRGLALTYLPALVFGGRVWPAVAISTIIFTLAHGDPLQGVTIFRFTIALAFCALFLWRKSLKLPIVLHWLVNAFNYAVVP